MTFDWSFGRKATCRLDKEKAAMNYLDNMWWLLCILPVIINGQQISVETETSQETKMTFQAPTLSDEDKHLIHMPNYLQCDGCKAVSYSLHKAFEDKHKQRKDQAWKMKEGDVLEVFGKS